jgi:serine/threonine protein kinase
VQFFSQGGGSKESNTMMTNSPPPPPHFPVMEHNSNNGGPSIPARSVLTKTNHNREESTTTITSTSTLVSPKLRSNLMREQKERDPLFFYEVVETLGVGSMGSVTKVRKRQDRIGGSARKDIQEAVREQNRKKECLNIPVIGGLFRLCIDDDLSLKYQKDNKCWDLLNPAKYFRGSNGDVFPQEMDTMEEVPPPMKSFAHVYFDNITDSTRSFGTHTSQLSGSVARIEYAMKSIHLSRVTGETFITELKNEIQILKELDHPYIVRPIETFEHRNQIFIVMELCNGGKLFLAVTPKHACHTN